MAEIRIARSTLVPDPGNAGVGSLRKVRLFSQTNPVRLPFRQTHFVFVYYLYEKRNLHVTILLQDPRVGGMRADDRHRHRAVQHQILHPAQRRQRDPAEYAAVCAGVLPPRHQVGPVHRICQRLPADPAGRRSLGPPTPTFLAYLGEVLLDYIFAFMALGLAQFFARPFQNRVVGVAVGTFMAGFLRFLCSFLSGVLIWGNLTDGLPAWTYSLVYNGSYMLPETLLTMVAAVLLCRVAPQLFDRQSAKA